MTNFRMLEAKVLVLLTFSSLAILAAADYLDEHFPAAVLDDTKLDTPHLIMKHKYPVETHYVETKDKYVLCLHRMPRPEGRPIFLMHGLLDASSTWIIMGPESGLGYYLYDQGYDVWMGNARGNRYSRNHTSFNPDTDGSFWRFSWHEIGYYDLPAMIDYVLNQTNQQKLTYFGHSQGTTSFFVMGSTRPEYNEKISSMHALAPVAFMKRIKTPLLNLGKNLMFTTGGIVIEILPHRDIYLKSCTVSKIMLDTCVEQIYQVMGKETKQMNDTMWPVIFAQVPAGASSMQPRHYLQLVDSNRFCQFDHGPLENMKRYGAVTPPDYPLEKITAPVGLYYAYNDYMTSEDDVKRLARLLPNVVEDHLYPHKKWNHITVVWGIEARVLAHERMLEVLKKYE